MNLNHPSYIQAAYYNTPLPNTGNMTSTDYDPFNIKIDSDMTPRNVTFSSTQQETKIPSYSTGPSNNISSVSPLLTGQNYTHNNSTQGHQQSVPMNTMMNSTWFFENQNFTPDFAGSNVAYSMSRSTSGNSNPEQPPTMFPIVRTVTPAPVVTNYLPAQASQVTASPMFPNTWSFPNNHTSPEDTGYDSNEDKTFSCTYTNCPIRFDTEEELQTHKKEAHRSGNQRNGVDQKGPYHCNRLNPVTGRRCNSSFHRPYDFTRHERNVHDLKKTKMACCLCTKAFSRPDALSRHYSHVHHKDPSQYMKKGSSSRSSRRHSRADDSTVSQTQMQQSVQQQQPLPQFPSQRNIVFPPESSLLSLRPTNPVVYHGF